MLPDGKRLELRIFFAVSCKGSPIPGAFHNLCLVFKKLQSQVPPLYFPGKPLGIDHERFTKRA